SISGVSGSNNHKFTVSFPSQTDAGTYTLTVGPAIQDWYGNDMNQNGKGPNGEASDRFTDTIYQAHPGSADVLSISGSFLTAKAGTDQNFTVTALSPNGGTDTNYTGTIHFTSSDPQAVLPPNYTFIGGNAGVHRFSITLKTAGPQSITATDVANS